LTARTLLVTAAQRRFPWLRFTASITPRDVIRRVRPSYLSLPRLASARARTLSAGLLLLAAGCSATTDTTTTTSLFPTSLTIEPSTFLGAIACSNQPGALKSYVATLTDVTSPLPDGAFTLPSSPPTPCSQSVSFQYAQAGSQYTVAIDGYDVPAAALTPCGGEVAGSRYMLAATGTPSGTCAAAITAGAPLVQPRWTTGCGDVASVPITDEKVVAACARPLEANTPGVTAQITVDPRASLGMLACATGADGMPRPGGTITFFDIKADDPSLNNYLGLACGTFTEPKLYATNLVAGATYTFRIAAHDGTDSVFKPKYTATCSAKAKSGLTVPAICEPFTQP
jgi:hypothetical protein